MWSSATRMKPAQTTIRFFANWLGKSAARQRNFPSPFTSRQLAPAFYALCSHQLSNCTPSPSLEALPSAIAAPAPSTSQLSQGVVFKPASSASWQKSFPGLCWGALFAAGGLLFAGSASCEAPPKESSPDEEAWGWSAEEQAKGGLEGAVVHARRGLAERLASLRVQAKFQKLPQPIVTAKGQQVTVRFPLSAGCDVGHLIMDLVWRLGATPNPASPGLGLVMQIQAWDSAVARQVTLSPSESVPKQGTQQGVERAKGKGLDRGLHLVIFVPTIFKDSGAEMEFVKRGFLISDELDAIISALKLSVANADRPSNILEPPKHRNRSSSSSGGQDQHVKDILSKLEKKGVVVYGADESEEGAEDEGWGTLAGYEEQKREIEDTVLLALQQPEVYDRIAKGTRKKFESNRPRAVLFEGPPGTGKTSCARVMAGRAGVPLLYVPLEVVASKYYGESERMLASVFNAIKELPNGAIVFLDEIDALAMARNSEMHEATRRVLSVLLRQMDGFERDKGSVVIGATNRKADLDPAVLSRFDATIAFGLPDRRTRADILAQYAKHLKSGELEVVALETEGMSGRDLRDVCEQAERHWAAKVIRGQVAEGLPPFDEYLACAVRRRETTAA